MAHAVWPRYSSGPGNNTGIAARIREYAIVGTSPQMPASDRQPKQLIDKLPLSERITFAHPSGSLFPNHVDRLESV
jgi:hypothetical protein